MRGSSFVTTGSGTSIVVVVDAWEWVVMEGKWSEDDGGGEGFVVQSLSLLMVVMWPCLDELPSE
jgi:hypothetical protein